MKKHTRINDTFLRSVEKPLLIFFAKKMPKWVNPDVLTSLGFLASIVVGVSYLLTNINKNFLWLASIGIFLNWFGDSLDGTLARFRKIERPRYGYFLDHTVDCVSQTMIILGFGLSPYVDYKLASLVLTGYLSLSILTYIITNVESVFKFSYGKMGPTEARIIAIIANTIGYYYGSSTIQLPLIGKVTSINLIFVFVAIFTYISFFETAIKKIIHLSKIDRKK
ncbi:MAG: CDP-alcohol phosphatidyltransferase family protein [Patescibacteria group bacterium]